MNSPKTELYRAASFSGEIRCGRVLSRFREDTLSEATSRNQLDKLNRLMRGADDRFGSSALVANRQATDDDDLPHRP